MPGRSWFQIKFARTRPSALLFARCLDRVVAAHLARSPLDRILSGAYNHDSIMLVLFLFFWSGATALVYEVIWSKYLTLMLGSTVQAQTVVLAVFMGGLALGNRLFGARADQAPQPLAIYGYVEVAIGLYAFFFNGFYQFADALFVLLGTGLLDHRALLLLLKGGLSVALLLGPTVLMGGTLPLLAAWLQRESSDAGRWSARFYSVNSLGAVFGAGMAGFFLVQSLGMVSSLQVTSMEPERSIDVRSSGLVHTNGSGSVSDTEKGPMSVPPPPLSTVYIPATR